MNKQELQKLFSDYLSAEGYRPEFDPDGDIRFKKEGATYLIFVHVEDPHLFTLTLPNILSLDEAQDRKQVVEACNSVNTRNLIAKCFLLGDAVWLTVELLFGNIEQFKDVFERAALSLSLTRMAYYEILQELENSPVPAAATGPEGALS